MISSKHWFIYRFLVVADVMALVLSVLVSLVVADGFHGASDFAQVLSMRFSLVNLFVSLLVLVVWLGMFNLFGLYRPSPVRGRRLHVISVVKGAVVGTMAIAAATTLFDIGLVSRQFLVVFLLVVIVSILVLRALLVWTLRRFNVGDQNQRNFLIIGTNDTAYHIGDIIEYNSALGYKLLGYLDDEQFDTSREITLLGKLEDFLPLLKKMVVDEVAIVMPVHSNQSRIQEIIDTCHEMGISIRFPVNQVFKGISKGNIWRFRSEGMLDMQGSTHMDVVVYSGHQVGARYLIKRVFDMAASSLILVAVSPVLLLAALAILITMGRPVLYLQDRYGYHGRVFKLIKFRTMVNNAHAMQEALRAQNERDGAAFKIKHDPRITWLGRWLRKTSLDELPQVFNVLKGNMSLVGPRPLPLSDYERIENRSHLRRLSVLPGITGTWQVSGRDHISFDEWMKMDLEYIDEWRLSGDIKILLKTIPAVLLGRGSA